jgi:hypothetical protein
MNTYQYSSDSDSDSDPDAQNLGIEVLPNPKTLAFRKALAEWKATQLKDILKDEQDTTALNAYLESTANLHSAFESYMYGNTKITATLPESLRSILGDVHTIPSDLRTEILYSLSRDLLEFPFTYDTNLINSFQADEVLKTNIIPNK